MALSKNPIIRYHTLDRCFSNSGRRFYIEDLIDECTAALAELNGEQSSVKRRQIFDDIRFMESEQGYGIELDRLKDGKKVYYRYADPHFSIRNQPLNEVEAQQMKEALLTLSRFKGMPQFEWVEEISTRLESAFGLVNDAENIIEFDNNPFLMGLEHISDLYNAIANKRVLKITYKSFKQESEKELTVHPYFLKQYNNRWFLFAFDERKQKISNLALDRILNIAETDRPYIPTNNDFRDYFEDMIGVSLPEGVVPQKVMLKIDDETWPYIKSKPIHGSQKIIDKENRIIELEIIINYELKSTLMAFGTGIKVLEPETLVQEIKIQLKRNISQY